MAPKGKAKGKGKGGDDSGSKVQSRWQTIYARHIFCVKMTKKDQALAKLKEGAKFDDVAREFSEDKARNGGLLGVWQTKNEVLEEFWIAAQEIDPSKTAAPQWAEAHTSIGYHILMLDDAKK